VIVGSWPKLALLLATHFAAKKMCCYIPAAKIGLVSVHACYFNFSPLRKVKNIKKCIKNFAHLMGGRFVGPTDYNWSVVGPREKVE
jgi:hypothetical protein